MELIGEGRNRKVYVLNSRLVIKFPKGEHGVIDNHCERATYLKHRDIYAKCYLIGDKLIMERLQPVKSSEKLPDWCDFIDCQQVGYDNKGTLKAYDYGYM